MVCDLDDKPVTADGPSPSSDTATHAFIYRHMPGIGGVVRTHSGYRHRLGGARRADSLRDHHDG